MIKIKFLSVGKTKETWIEEGLQEYIKRLSSEASFEFVWFKDEKSLELQILKEKQVILLDPLGKMMNSVEFADFLFREFEREGSRLSLAIGGATGFSDEIKKGRFLLSFSKMTFTHQMSRLILLEQIFRAFEIKKGSPYHK
ncbi:MAG: rlmH [Chlamydiia bacterium]|nr:rlmH [Chlamydiia bacterium]